MEKKRNGLTSMPIRDVWFVFWNHKWIFAVLCAIGLVAGCVAMIVAQLQHNANPQYMTTAAIAVVSENKHGTYYSGSVNPNASEIYLAEDLADAVIYVAESNLVLNEVISNLNLIGVNTQRLQEALTLNQYEDSQIIRIDFIWSNQNEGVEILSEIVDVLPDVLIQTLKVGSVEVVDTPESFLYSDGASVWSVIVGITVAFAIAVLYCLFIIVLRPAFYSTEFLKHCMRLPIVGELMHEKKLRNIAQGDLVSTGTQVLSGRFIECCSATAYTLSHHLKEGKNRVIYVTSAAAGEGKTVTVAMLARQLAQQKMKVLMVDFDIRHPSLSHFFLKEFDENKTLNAVVKGKTNIEDAIIPIGENLDILPSYLEDKRRHISDFSLEPLNDIIANYDCILIDTSPIGLVADALHLNQITNQVLMVIRQGMVWQEMVLNSKEELEQNGAEIIGCVFNGISTKTPITRYYYRHYGYDYYTNGKKGKVSNDDRKIAYTKD